jgi:general stress protein CsbA
LFPPLILSVFFIIIIFNDDCFVGLVLEVMLLG